MISTTAATFNTTPAAVSTRASAVPRFSTPLRPRMPTTRAGSPIARNSMARGLRRILLLRGELPDQIHFRLSIRRSVGPEHVVEPDGRLVQHIGMLPRLPGQVRLRPAGDEPPVDHADPLPLRDRQYRLERASHRARHVLRANHRSVVPLEPRDLTPEVLRPAVVVKGDDIGLAQLNLLQRTEVGAVRRGVDRPHA